MIIQKLSTDDDDDDDDDDPMTQGRRDALLWLQITVRLFFSVLNF
jgi:hypothetical protein